MERFQQAARRRPGITNDPKYLSSGMHCQRWCGAGWTRAGRAWWTQGELGFPSNEWGPGARLSSGSGHMPI